VYPRTSAIRKVLISAVVPPDAESSPSPTRSPV
jgi:hypothetical protein